MCESNLRVKKWVESGSNLLLLFSPTICSCRPIHFASPPSCDPHGSSLQLRTQLYDGIQGFSCFFGFVYRLHSQLNFIFWEISLLLRLNKFVYGYLIHLQFYSYRNQMYQQRKENKQVNNGKSKFKSNVSFSWSAAVISEYEELNNGCLFHFYHNLGIHSNQWDLKFGALFGNIHRNIFFQL